MKDTNSKNLVIVFPDDVRQENARLLLKRISILREDKYLCDTIENVLKEEHERLFPEKKYGKRV